MTGHDTTRTSKALRLVRTLVTLVLVLAVGFGLGSFVAWLSTNAGVLDGPPSSVAQPAPLQTPGNATYTAWDEEQSPNYYRVAGAAVVADQPDAGSIWYAPLDKRGRAQGAIALVTYESMRAGSERERGDLSELEPSGWGHNAEVDIAMPDGTIYHGQLFNRSHLVAKSLGGDDGLHNLVTATRTQNVGANIDGTEGGMAYAEGLVRSWLYQHQDGTVYYAVTPVYEGKELVARSVIVDVRTSDGSIDQRVEVYNAARGFAIDYATGGFSITERAEDAAADIRARHGMSKSSATTDSSMAGNGSSTVTPTGNPESENGERKVIVTGSGEAYHHDETCSGLENARSMEWVTVSEAEGMGRHPCGICGG